MAKIWHKHLLDVGSLNTFFWGGRGGFVSILALDHMILSKKTKIGIEFNYSDQAQKMGWVKETQAVPI